MITIYYGIEGHYKDVTKDCLEKCKHGEKIIIPDNDIFRADLFGDPIYGCLKHILIKDNETGLSQLFEEKVIEISLQLFTKKGDNEDNNKDNENPTITVYYGIEGNYRDVTLACLYSCSKENGELVIPDKDYLRSSIFGDPLYGHIKHLIIKNNKTGKSKRYDEQHLRIDLSLFSPTLYEKKGYSKELMEYVKPFTPDLLEKDNLFCFWTGENDMPSRRFECFKSLVNTGLNVVLITPYNLDSFILPDHPLHPSYKNLLLEHRADYLRSYFMRFYGGAYTDIKMMKDSWLPYFNTIKSDDNIWAIGYPEKYPCDVSNVEDKELYRKLVENYSKLIGNGYYIIKKDTPFVVEWYETVWNILDQKRELLEKSPFQENPIYRFNKYYPYPIKWTEILGNIFHPLCYKYMDHIKGLLSHIDIFHYKY